MVKFIVFWFCLVTINISNAQSKVASIKYLYSDLFGNQTEILIANESKAFYQVLRNSSLETKSSKTKIDSENNVIKITDFTNSTVANFIFLENSKDFNYSYLKTQKEELMVLDKMPKLNWNLVNDSKVIGEFNCKKAEVDFRGRKFIAWYAPKIAIPFGPFKFKGLPGLIINIESTYNGNTIQWNLTSLKFNDSLSIPSKDDFEGRETTLRAVLTNETEKRNEHSKRTTARINRGVRQTKLTIERLGAERIYEWETEDGEKK